MIGALVGLSSHLGAVIHFGPTVGDDTDFLLKLTPLRECLQILKKGSI